MSENELISPPIFDKPITTNDRFPVGQKELSRVIDGEFDGDGLDDDDDDFPIFFFLSKSALQHAVVLQERG